MDWEAMTAAIGMSDATRRGLTLLPAESLRARGINGPDVRGALWCRLDATVDPNRLTAALRSRLRALGATVDNDREVTEIGDGAIEYREPGGATRSGHADLVIVCPESATLRTEGFVTEPMAPVIDTTISDSDTLRSQAGFRGIAALLGPREPDARRLAARLRMTQLDDGRVLVGEAVITLTSTASGPVDPTSHLLRRAEEILGASLPPIEGHWTAEHAAPADGSTYTVDQVAPRTWSVSGVTELGIAALPALAWRVLNDALDDQAPSGSAPDAKTTGPGGETDRSASLLGGDGNHGGAIPVGVRD